MKRFTLMASASMLLVAFVLLAGCSGSTSTNSGASGSVGTITGTIDLSSMKSTRASGPITVTVDGTNLSTTADPTTGQFTIPNVPAGLQTLVAYTASQAIDLVVSVEQGKYAEVGSLRLQDAGQLSGIVKTINATTNQDVPVADALVTVTAATSSATANPVAQPVRMCRTNAGGGYTIFGLPAGDYQLTVSHRGYTTATQQITITALTTTNGDITLTPDANATEQTGTVSGIATMTAGTGPTQPLTGVLVTLIPSSSAGGGTGSAEVGQIVYPSCLLKGLMAFTASDGTYTISGVPVGDYTAIASRPGLEPAQQSITVTANTTTAADFNLTLYQIQTGIITGTVTNATSNAPVPGAWVRAIVQIAQPMTATGTSSPNGGCCAITSDKIIMMAETDQQGNYQLIVPTAVSQIDVERRGFADQQVPVTVTAGGTTTADIALQPSATTGDGDIVLSGLVGTLSSNSANLTPVPVPGATVAVVTVVPPGSMMPTRLYTATTNENGQYTLTLSPGNYTVYAEKDSLISDMTTCNLTADHQLNLVLKQNPSTSPPLPPTPRSKR